MCRRSSAYIAPAECAICLDSNEKSLITLECGHMFHVLCMMKWVVKNRSCPLCRTAITDNGVTALVVHYLR